MLNITSEKMIVVKKRMKHLIVLLFLGLSFPTIAQTIKTTYDVYADKKKIGTLNVTRQRTQNADVPTMTIDTRMQLNVKSHRSSYSLSSNEHAHLGSKGLLNFNARYEENGTKSRIEGRLTEGRFSGTVKAGTETHEFLFPPLGYDAISFVITNHPSKSGALDQSLKYINWPTMEFQEEQRATAGKEELWLAKESFQCHIIDFNTPDSKGRRWIAKDHLGDFLVKEVGNDESGLYSLILTSHVIRSRD